LKITGIKRTKGQLSDNEQTSLFECNKQNNIITEFVIFMLDYESYGETNKQ